VTQPSAKWSADSSPRQSGNLKGPSTTTKPTKAGMTLIKKHAWANSTRKFNHQSQKTWKESFTPASLSPVFSKQQTLSALQKHPASSAPTTAPPTTPWNLIHALSPFSPTQPCQSLPQLIFLKCKPPSLPTAPPTHHLTTSLTRTPTIATGTQVHQDQPTAPQTRDHSSSHAQPQPNNHAVSFQLVAN
jgi:hypothetical protein